MNIEKEIEELRGILTVVGRILFVMGKEGKREASVNELRKKVGTGIYQSLTAGVKKGYWKYNIDRDLISLTEKGMKIAKTLSQLKLE